LSLHSTMDALRAMSRTRHDGQILLERPSGDQRRVGKGRRGRRLHQGAHVARLDPPGAQPQALGARRPPLATCSANRPLPRATSTLTTPASCRSDADQRNTSAARGFASSSLALALRMSVKNRKPRSRGPGGRPRGPKASPEATRWRAPSRRTSARRSLGPRPTMYGTGRWDRRGHGSRSGDASPQAIGRSRTSRSGAKAPPTAPGPRPLTPRTFVQFIAGSRRPPDGYGTPRACRARPHPRSAPARSRPRGG
jgi:hypothetical protein